MKKTNSEDLGIDQEDVRLLPHLSTTKSTAQVTSAGREMDALVAEKVMNWTLVPDKFKVPVMGGLGYNENHGDPVPVYYAGEKFIDFAWKFRFSDDIRAAWLVVEKLGDMSVHHFYDPTLEEWFYHVAWRSPDGIEHHCSEEANTAPLAICLAALRAVGA